jgi:hypothetical protein
MLSRCYREVVEIGELVSIVIEIAMWSTQTHKFGNVGLRSHQTHKFGNVGLRSQLRKNTGTINRHVLFVFIIVVPLPQSSITVVIDHRTIRQCLHPKSPLQAPPAGAVEHHNPQSTPFTTNIDIRTQRTTNVKKASQTKMKHIQTYINKASSNLWQLDLSLMSSIYMCLL